ncbi:hypothetical protein CPC08DRAFT_715548 [Agrocybe pediades]|nr:hypothetical protein CPC08DRAFT_715548 [Agrocybe pediades]
MPCRGCGSSNSVDVSPGNSLSACPHGDDCCSACSGVRELRRRVAEYAEKLRTCLEVLQQKEATLNHAHSFILNKLPNEITRMIFQIAYYEVPETQELRVVNGTDPFIKSERLSQAINLSAVCKQWREVALDMPRLWSDIHVRLHCQVNVGAFAIFDDIMRRSQLLPLSISLYSSPLEYQDPGLADVRYHPVLGILRKESKRWHSLTMYLPRSVVCDFLDSEACDDLSNVRSLNVHSTNGLGDEVDEDSEFPEWEGKQLQPNNLCLNALTMVGLKTYSWSNVTSIVAVGLTARQGSQLLRNAPLLTSYALLRVNESEPTTDLEPEFVHANLRQLHYDVYHSSDENPGNIFDVNVFPNLTDLNYSSCRRLGDDPFLSYVERYHSPLQNLLINHSDFDVDVFLGVFRATPTLVHVELYPFAFNPMDYHEDSFLPLFESLSILWLTIRQCPSTAFEEPYHVRLKHTELRSQCHSRTRRS